MNTENFLVSENKQVNLADYPTDFTGDYTDKEQAVKDLKKNIKRLSEMQDVLWAQDIQSLLIIFQAMDAAGKDSAIKHVMSGLNPQGVHVTSFKQPSAEELDHDYLWRSMKELPQRGRIGIFNRSYYEEVLVVRVHPAILQNQKLPPHVKTDENIWRKTESMSSSFFLMFQRKNRKNDFSHESRKLIKIGNFPLPTRKNAAFGMII